MTTIHFASSTTHAKRNNTGSFTTFQEKVGLRQYIVRFAKLAAALPDCLLHFPGAAFDAVLCTGVYLGGKQVMPQLGTNMAKDGTLLQCFTKPQVTIYVRHKFFKSKIRLFLSISRAK